MNGARFLALCWLGDLELRGGNCRSTSAALQRIVTRAIARNMIMGMSGEFWAPYSLDADRQLGPGLSMWSGTHMSFAFNANPLGHLLRYLLLVYRNGKSTGLSVFDTYLEPKPEPIPDSPPHPM